MLMNIKTSQRNDARAQFRAGITACLPTIPGYWSIGFAAGAIGTLSGFTTVQTALLASALYAGSAQFLFYSLWATGAEIASVVLSVFLVNLRYLLMSSAMSLFFRDYTTTQKIISGLLLTDETFGVAVQKGSQQNSVPFAWMLGLNLAAWINWILACVVGAGLASVLPPSLMEGLSFSLVSMFIGLVLMIWFASRRKTLESFSIAAAVIITLLTASHTDMSVVVIVAASVSATLATLGLRLFSREEK
ncbi:branched-chain amino acid ABC transporter permease [Lelliottia amnigena]|uniref:AzlC family ABC transporter permease n=1 Tax=Lelliottia amnigena TaxID=61646 RepID=UPI001039B320|nr:AzlC family ABC transporter permease [Lelliottia amnigena]TCD20849.1 branched-chain amino acid ABC transporter permease [Lelliottia amnigena]